MQFALRFYRLKRIKRRCGYDLACYYENVRIKILPNNFVGTMRTQPTEKNGSFYDFSRLIGASKVMRHIYQQVQQVAPANTTILIQGETGTGKELIAQALHAHSRRATKPFLKVNCGALTESLIEAELFGYERGAFTGADASKPGRFELAAGGTLLLDEVGELSLTAQAKLLRLLQTREFERLGGTVTIQCDVRLIAATNRQLEQEVAAGRFRADLFYRLNVFTITLPTLRERREEIGTLAEYFLTKHAQVHGKSIRRFAPEAIDLLLAHAWPGNVRELENTIERAVVICDGNVIRHYHLPPDLQTLRLTTTLPSKGLAAAVSAYERELLCEALQTAQGNRNQAARLLKISERLLSYKIKKYNIVQADIGW
jgi:Nif-specific regulatory protein